MTINYNISEVREYINWIYFFYAWGLNGKPEEERTALREDAEKMLDSWEGRYRTHTVFRIVDANSDGDDIIADGVRIPMLRQQHEGKNGRPNLCLADYIRPLSMGKKDRIGVFAATVDYAMQNIGTDDPYQRMLSQTLSDRLAEATTERMHLEVRRKYWGYAPDENLSIEDLLVEKYDGIRPAVGYPSLPDSSVNFILDRIIDMGSIGIRLTESGMMVPHASVSGLIIAHPKAKYFDLGRIGQDQFEDYARRRGLPADRLRKFLENTILPA